MGKKHADEIGKKSKMRLGKTQTEIGKETERQDWERDRQTRLGKRHTDEIVKEIYRQRLVNRQTYEIGKETDRDWER